MCKNSVSWIYRSDANYSWESGFAVDDDLLFYDRSGRIRLVIEKGGRITVTKDYAWNGCSPKVCLFDLSWGTPDGVVHALTGRPKTYFASMVHDALYQFLEAGSPLSRGQADQAFLRLMAASEFSPRYLYWLAVRLFGWLVWRGKKARRKWQGTSASTSDFGA